MVQYIASSLVQGLHAGMVPVFIDITRNGVTRTIETLTYTNTTFSAVFVPATMELGFYQAGSRHPGITESTPETDWQFLGLRAAPSRVLLAGEVIDEFDETFHNATTVYNEGTAVVSELTATPLLPNTGLIEADVRLQGLSINGSLQPGDHVTVDVTLTTSQALTGLFKIALNSTQGTLLEIIVYFEIESAMPSFLILPSSLHARITPGISRVFEFNVTNVGMTSFGAVQALLPNTDFISLISFGIPQDNNQTLRVGSGESTTLSILVQVPESQQLGDIIASVLMLSLQVSAFIPIRLTVSSNLLMNLTVIVEDEFTYFASGEPLVNDAAITMINYQRGIRITLTTETSNGTVTFINIHEDRYEMFVEAPDHLSVRQVIITSVDDPVMTVFMQRQTVTYTWSMTPVEFENNYILTVEADFVTHVPIPVVTVSPTEIDLEALERGLISSFQLNITNHGLIRANDTAIQFPNNHPLLTFNTSITELGYIEPLSSVIATVEVNFKTSEK